MKRNNYHPKRKSLWDIWFLRDKNGFDMFHLQNNISIAARDRHDGVSIGHAFSKDLIKWRELPTALDPGRKNEWDDRSLWTGSCIKKGKRYYMFW